MESIKMTNPIPNPNPMSIIMTTAVPEQMHNTKIVPTSYDVGTTSKMQSTLVMNMTTDPTVTQETDSSYKAFAIDEELYCTHAPSQYSW